VSVAEPAFAGPDRPAVGRAALWLAAAGLAAATHGGLALMALRAPPPLPEEAAPPAITIDLAPMPQAAEAAEERIAPDTMDAPERMPTPKPTLPAVEPLPRQEVAALEPPPDLGAPPVADMVPEVELPAPEAVPRPRARPENLRVVEPEAAPSQAAARAQVRAEGAEAAAAARPSAGSRGVSPAKWRAQLMAHLERLKRYPPGARRRREEGVVQVRFVVDDGGNVRSARIVRSSGSAELDEAVVALLRRASPLPAPPPGAPREVVAPVGFELR
jgi:protein TonB